MNKIEEFKEEVRQRVSEYAKNEELKYSAHQFMASSIPAMYSYNFSWLGRPIIQYPQDILALQEIIWKTKPDLIVETGIAHGGSLIFNASMLKLINPQGRVLGIDIDIREHNRAEIESHFIYKEGLIKMIEGSSIDEKVISQVKDECLQFEKVMVILDSNHTHDHVLQELKLYSDFVAKGCYLVVFDTMVDEYDEDLFADKKWGKGDNPKTAVKSFLSENTNFEVDHFFDNKLLISVGPNGYLKKI